MKPIPSPADIGLFDLSESATHQMRVDRIVDEFITAIKTGDMHPFSTDQTKVVFFPAEADYCRNPSLDAAVAVLNAAGWKVEHHIRTSGRGWFHAIEWTP